MELESALTSVDWSEIYNTEDPNIVLDIIIRNVNVSFDTIAPLKKITYRYEKPNLCLKKDILAAMALRDKARNHGNKSMFKKLRNKVNELVEFSE